MAKIYFIHIRNRDAAGVIQNKGGRTIAYEWINEDGQPVDEGGTGVRYSEALCSPNDHFDKTRGRLIAEGRINCPDRGITYNCAVEGTKVIEAIFNDLGIEHGTHDHS